MVDIKALICEGLFRMYMTSKTRKRKMWASIHDWHEGSNIY